MVGERRPSGLLTLTSSGDGQPGLVLPDSTVGVATAVGSMPGQDPREAAVVVVGELPDLPHLPELPARGPGADLVGRTAALLPGLPVDLQPSGWRLTARPGVDGRRAASYLSRDLDALEEALEGRIGPVKVALAGPWTLAAGLQLPRGEPVLADAGAMRDLTQSLAEGVTAHIDDLRRRLPGSTVVLQVDEPSLPSVLLGRVPTFSGAGAIAAVSLTDATSVLAAVLGAATVSGVPVVAHCCAATPPVRVFQDAGFAAVSLDLALVGTACDTALGEGLESGLVLAAGLVPAVNAALSDPAATVEPLRQLWHRLGLAPERLGRQVLVTPTCGMSGASPGHVLQALRLCRGAAQALVDDPEGAG